MRVIDYDQTFQAEGEVVIALGNFDGLHLGHQALIEEAVRIAEETNRKSAVLLFKNHTADLLARPEKRFLTSLKDKEKLLTQLGVDVVYLRSFDAAFAGTTKENFLTDVLVKDLGVKHVVVGHDYTFGKKAAGTAKDLENAVQEGLFGLSLMEDVQYQGERISSTRIRDAVLRGEVEEAGHMLGYPYRLHGQVASGAHRGHGLGFATANLALDFPYVVPMEGVYLTRTLVEGKRHYGMTSVGTNPTFSDGTEETIETHLFDFDRTIYDLPIQVEFLRYERHNIRFDSSEALSAQMKEDDVLLRSWIADFD